MISLVPVCVCAYLVVCCCPKVIQLYPHRFTHTEKHCNPVRLWLGGRPAAEIQKKKKTQAKLAKDIRVCDWSTAQFVWSMATIGFSGWWHVEALIKCLSVSRSFEVRGRLLGKPGKETTCPFASNSTGPLSKAVKSLCVSGCVLCVDP